MKMKYFTRLVALCLGDTLQYRLKVSVARAAVKYHVTRQVAARATVSWSPRAPIAEIWGSMWAYSTQTVRPSPKLTHERHILGMSLLPEPIRIAQNSVM